MKKRRSIEVRMARFFVGMKDLTKLSTPELASLLRRWPHLVLPKKATLNDVCREHGLGSDPPGLRLSRDRPLGQLRMQVFSGWFHDNEGKPIELAISYESWSGAVHAKLGDSFKGYEETQQFLIGALNALPFEYRRVVKNTVLLHRIPQIEKPTSWLDRSVDQMLQENDTPAQDQLTMGTHAPARIGLFELQGIDEHEGFFHYLPRVVRDYNCFDPATHHRKRRGVPAAARFFDGFTGWERSDGHVGRFVQVGRAMAGRGPARRIFAALSSIPSDRPGRRTPSTKYSMDDVKRFLSPTTPGRGRRR